MMDASFIDTIIENAKPEYQEQHGLLYSNKHFAPITPPTATGITVHSLSSIVDFLQGEQEDGKNYTLSVEDPETVRLFSELNAARSREILVYCSPQKDAFDFNRKYEVEQFVIAMQAQFVQDDTTAAILRMVGNITAGAEHITEDDGVTQTVSTKKGISKVGWEQVPNPVELRPYRTFSEIEQPASKFVLRINTDGPTAALYEADGGAWKDEATQSIKKYLVNGLKSAGIERVTVLA